MKSKDKIILYLDNGLSEKEKAEFETELLHSSSLAEELKIIRNQLDEIKKYASADLDAEYFDGIVPAFRQNTSNNNVNKIFPVLQYKKFIPAAAAVLIGLLFILLYDNQKNSFDLSGLTEGELQNIASEYQLFENSSSLSDMTITRISDKVDSLYSDAFTASGGDIKYIESIDYNSLVAALSDEEVETIYQQLINKNFTIGGL